MAKTLYISDLDGTLLDNNSLVSQESARIISDLSRRGALITVATARTPATVSKLLEATVTTVPAIVLTGAALWDRNTQHYISPIYMTRSLAAGVLQELADEQIDPFVYTLSSPSALLEVYHGLEMNRKERDFYEQRKNLQLKRFYIGMNVPDACLDKMMLAFATGPTDNIMRVADKLKKRGDCSVSAYPDIFDPKASLIEIFAPGVSKAGAVMRLKKECGADRLVVFGDNLNDLPMFEVADLAVAVGNALPEVKTRAGEVIGPNSADAVARFIEKDCCL